MEKLLALLKLILFPFRFGSVTIHVEEHKATRYEVREITKL